MARYRISAAARDDLHGIAEYTRDAWGAEQALIYIAQLEEAFRLIEKTPCIGRSIPGTRYRRFQTGHHGIFYRESRRGVFVVRVLHERVLPQKHLSGED